MKNLLITIALICAGCSSSVKQTTLPEEKSSECLFMEEVCREAESFQKEFDSHTEDEQKELIPVLNSYIEHCESARKACKKSMRSTR